MKQILKKAYAKINLSLDVLKKRDDGYHEVSMIMHQIDLHDDVLISVEKQDQAEHTILLSTDHPAVPSDATNIAFRAAEAVLKEYNGSERFHIAIEIKKRIPVAAGLAGGSTDAAAVLTGLNELLSLDIPAQRLKQIGKALGADVPFCLTGGNALAEGIGEKLQPLPAVRLDLLLSKPSIEVSTAKVYGGLDLRQIKNHSDNNQLVQDLQVLATAQDQGKSKTEQLILQKKMYRNMNNVLENVTLNAYPIVMYTKNMMTKTDALHVLMSGSGPSVFALYADEVMLHAAYERMIKQNHETFIIKTVGKDGR